MLRMEPQQVGNRRGSSTGHGRRRSCSSNANSPSIQPLIDVLASHRSIWPWSPRARTSISNSEANLNGCESAGFRNERVDVSPFVFPQGVIRRWSRAISGNVTTSQEIVHFAPFRRLTRGLALTRPREERVRIILRNGKRCGSLHECSRDRTWCLLNSSGTCRSGRFPRRSSE